MKQTVAKESEDGKTLEEWDFLLCQEGEKKLVFRFFGFRRWRRETAGETIPWAEPPETWLAVDVMEKRTIKDPPEVPESVLMEARQFILSRIEFDI